MPNFDLFSGGGVPNSELWLERGGVSNFYLASVPPAPTLLNGTALRKNGKNLVWNAMWS